MSDIDSLYRVSPRQAKPLIAQILEAGLVPSIEGPPGCGKSAIIHQLAEAGNLTMIDHRMSTSSPEDMSGLPMFKDGFARFAPFIDLFPLEGISTTNGNGWLLFMDEFNSAPKSTMAASYKLILDRMVGQYKLHPDVHIAIAGNRQLDKAITNQLSTAMRSRLIHLEIEVRFKEWLEDVAIPQNYDSRIIAYLSQYPNKLMDFDPDSNEKTFASPRTWEFTNRLLGVSGSTKKIPNEMIPMFAGTITSGIAVDFVQFTAVYESIVQVKDVVANPHTVPVPYELNLRWATVTALVEAVNTTTYEAIDIYINRFDTSFKILFNRMLVQRNPQYRTNPIWVKTQISLQKYLNDY